MGIRKDFQIFFRFLTIVPQFAHTVNYFLFSKSILTYLLYFHLKFQVKDLHSKLKSYLNKIMTLTDRQQAFGNFSFKKVTIKKLKIEGNLIYKKASNTNPIQDAVQDAMGLQDLLSNQTTSIRELKRRLEDSVSSSTSSQIIGEKTFTGNVTFRNATVEDMKAGTINGVNLTDLRHRVWSKSRPQVITGKNVFLKDVKVLGNVAVGGELNYVITLVGLNWIIFLIYLFFLLFILLFFLLIYIPL